MSYNIENLKKKIRYRSTYRGTKEMDNLLGSFVDSIIEKIDEHDLVKLLKFLDLDDENILKFYKNIKTDVIVDDNEITRMFKDFKLKKFWWRRDWDSNPGKSCPFAGFQDRCFQPLSHLSVRSVLLLNLFNSTRKSINEYKY